MKMQGNTIKLKGLVFALFLLLAFSTSSFASNQATTHSTGNQQKVEQSAERININQATAEQLSSLPGIGPSKAEAIIKAREQNGGFANSNELQTVKGIGEKTVARLEPLISF